MFNSLELQRTFYGCKKKFAAWFVSKIKQVDFDSILESKNVAEMFFRKDINTIVKRAEEDFFNQLKEICERNFILYNGLKNSLSTNIVFVLQPFAYWTNKEFSFEEKEIFQNLEQLNKNSTWKMYKKKMTKKLYKKIIELYSDIAKKNNIDFIDSNIYFNVKKHLFVDAVHLNDNGNKIAAQVILKNMRSKND
jgi:hypothetical protein